MSARPLAAATASSPHIVQQRRDLAPLGAVIRMRRQQRGVFNPQPGEPAGGAVLRQLLLLQPQPGGAACSGVSDVCCFVTRSCWY